MGTLSGSVSGNINLSGEGGTDDYRELSYKPSINNVVLDGNLTSADLNIPENAVQDVKVNGYSVVDEGVADVTVPVQGVNVDGQSVVDENGVADITLPAIPVEDVKVDGNSVVTNKTANINIPVKDVKVNNQSVVNNAGIANINIGSGTVTDVKVDGESVVNNQGVALITTPDLSDLPDVSIDNLADGQVLAWDAVENKWVNVTGGSGGAAASEMTQTEYDNLTEQQKKDGSIRFIKTNTYSKEKEVKFLNNTTPIYTGDNLAGGSGYFRHDNSYMLEITVNGNTGSASRYHNGILEYTSNACTYINGVFTFDSYFVQNYCGTSTADINFNYQVTNPVGSKIYFMDVAYNSNL